MVNSYRGYINDFVSPMKRSDSRMTFLTTFSVKTEDDDDHCKIQSLVVLKIGAIIVVDIKNALIKAFDMEGNFMDSVHNGARIFGLTVTSDNTFAVTIMGNKKIAFYNLVNGKLNTIRLVDTDRRYFGIAKLPNNNLIVGTKEVINLMTPDAEVIGRLTSQIDFVNPYHICVSKRGNIVVVDSEKVCIVVFDDKGYVQRQVHLGYLYLRGIAVTDDVILFVNNLKDYVFMISLHEDHMTCIRANERKLIKPTALCVLDDGRIVISEEEVVKIFRLDEYKTMMTSYVTKLRRFKSVFLTLPWREVFETIGLLGFLEIGLVLCMNVRY